MAVAATALSRRPAPAGEGGGILEYARALVDFAEGRAGAPAAPPSRLSLSELREAIRRLGRDPEEVLRRVWERLVEAAPADLRAEPDSPEARRLKLERMRPYLDIAQNRQLLETAARKPEGAAPRTAGEETAPITGKTPEKPSGLRFEPL